MKLEEFIPGFCQGLSRVFIAYPFDFLKTKIQMGATNGVVDYLRTHGIRSVYRGMSIPMVVIPIERSLQWAMFDKLENWKQGSPFVNGALTGFILMSFSLPANTINNNRILHGLTVRQALFQNFQGVRWLYRGMGPEIARIFGSTAMYMGVYSHLRRWNESRVWYWTIFNSSVASISMWTCMFPFDTMKVALQTRINDGRSATVVDVLRERYGKQGATCGLWCGILPVYARTIPTSGVGMLIQEWARRTFVDAEVREQSRN